MALLSVLSDPITSGQLTSHLALNGHVSIVTTVVGLNFPALYANIHLHHQNKRFLQKEKKCLSITFAELTSRP